MKKTLLTFAILSGSLLAENHALVIGCCSEYKNAGVPLLGGTKNDARHIRDILIDRGINQKNIDFLVEKNATYKNITQSLKSMESSNLGKGDTLYVFYSGHGTSVGDRSNFGKKLAGNLDILKRLNNSAGLITYDLNKENLMDTLIITSRDFKPTFQTLDKKGVNIVWIADACYAGNAHRSGGKNKSKSVVLNTEEVGWSQSDTIPEYNHLLFYGATLTGIPTQETTYKKEKRGSFTVAIENCLKKSYSTRKITNANLKKCLKQNYPPYTSNSAIYPIDSSLDDISVINAPQSYRGSDIDPLVYDRDKLFALQSGQSSLEIDVSSKYDTSLAINTFCFGESLEINITNKGTNDSVIVFTRDKDDRVIMLTPNKESNRFTETNTIVETNVTKPFGIDEIKVFTTSNQLLYEKVSTFKNNLNGVLNDEEVTKLYNIFIKNNDFRTAYLEVETIDTPVKECRKGDI